MTVPRIILLIIILFFTGSVTLRSQTVNIMITGIRSSSGQVIVSAFKDDESFEKEKPFFSKKFDKSKMENGTILVRLTLPPGTYGP